MNKLIKYVCILVIFEINLYQWCSANTNIQNIVVAGLDSNDVVVWDFSTGQRLLTLTRHTDFVYSVKIIDNQTTLASGSCDDSIIIWNLTFGSSPSATIRLTLTGHTDCVTGLEYLSTGYLASVSNDKKLLIWNVTTGDLVKSINSIHTFGIRCIKQISSNRFVTGGSDNRINVFDINSYSILQMLNEHTNDVNSVSVLSNGLLVSASLDNTVKIWNLTNGISSLSTFNPFSSSVSYAKQLNNGSLLVGGASSSLYLYDVSSASSPIRLSVWNDFFPDGMSYGLVEYQGILIASNNKGIIKVVNESSNLVYIDLLTPSTTDEIFCLDIYQSSYITTVAEATTSAITTTTTITKSTANSTTTTTTTNTTTITTKSTTTSTTTTKTTMTTTTTISTYKQVNPSIIFGDTNSIIKVMSPYLNSTIFTLSGHTGVIEWLKVLPDGRLASASGDTTVRIWNLTTGTLDMTLYGHTDKAYSIDVLVNGYLVSGGYDKALRVWNTTTGSLVANITNAHSNNITVVKTLNNCFFATGSTDTIVKIWDSGSLTFLRNLTGHTSTVYAIEYLSDGTIVTGAQDNQAIIWNLTSGEQLVSFNPLLSNTIYAIKEISPQVIAIGGLVSKVVFYKVNCSTAPVLIKSITPSPSCGTLFSMIVATVQYGIFNSTVLYASCSSSNTVAFNVTNSASIAVLTSINIGSSYSLYAIEKSVYDQLPLSSSTCPVITTTTSKTSAITTTTTTTATTSTISTKIEANSWSLYTIVPHHDMPYIDDNMIDSIQQSNALRCGLCCTSSSLCRVFVYTTNSRNCSLYKQLPSLLASSSISTLYYRN